jgi:hypothetical protein
MFGFHLQLSSASRRTMNNFDIFNSTSYEGARKLDYKFEDYLSMVVKGVIVYVQVVLVFWQEIFFKFLSLFSSTRPKDISGQIALVTGNIGFDFWSISSSQRFVGRWCKWTRTRYRFSVS